jgi:hypothetical protein
MTKEELLRRHHLVELHEAEHHVSRGEEIIKQHKQRASRLRARGASPSRDSEKLLELLEVSQELFEQHLELIRRELESDQ